MSELTPKQTLFAAEYLTDLNCTQAAIRAGYSARSAAEQGYDLLRKPQIRELVETEIQLRSERLKLSADYVLEGICDTIERCKQARAVLDRLGNPVIVATSRGNLVAAYTFDPGAALKGYELLGKHLGLFTNKTEQNEEKKEEMQMRIVHVGS